MREYLLLMHKDTTREEASADWAPYLQRLAESGGFRGGSEIGPGESFRKDGLAGPVARHLAGFLRVEATDLAAARALLQGNPTYEAGGTVEIRELPQTP